LVGCSYGAVVALIVALRRPDLVRQLVLVAGVFHRDGWVPEAIDPSNEPPEFLRSCTERSLPTASITIRLSWS
jgi:pimeloyl-ACP methyl ester carboxylesterase